MCIERERARHPAAERLAHHEIQRRDVGQFITHHVAFDNAGEMRPDTLGRHLLAQQRTHAASEPIPRGWIPCAYLYPAHPLRDHDGRARPFDAPRYVAFQRMLSARASVAIAGKVRRGTNERVAELLSAQAG